MTMGAGVPANFLALIEGYGCDVLKGLGEALEGEPSVSVRVNRSKGDAVPPGTTAVPWCESGYYLEERPMFTLDPALHQGRYYVQDASSMFIGRVIRHLTAGEGCVTYLDACAAPGGKTTAAIDALPEGSLVVANEYVAQRAAVLRENLTKWGYGLTVVTQGDTRRFAGHREEYDIIAADVPCSGEGMMRKDEQARRQWSPALVKECVGRQREIVDNLWGALKRGGYLIYSTCTFNREENEQMVEYIMARYGAEPVEVPVEKGWNIIGAVGSDVACYRFIPGKVRGEGLFMAVLRKPMVDDEGATAWKPKCEGKQRGGKERALALPKGVERMVRPGSCRLVMEGDRVMAQPMTELRVSAGVPQWHIGTVKGKDFVPEQALAMSDLLDEGAFVRCDVDRSTALEYLRAQAVRLPDDTPRGIVLLTYGGRPLGFVKNLGNRANNLYPKGWRILSNRD